MKGNISHNLLTIGLEETTALSDVVHSNWLAEGRKVLDFEDRMASIHSIPSSCAIAVSSGSAALYLSLVAMQAEGKKVGLPVYSCSSLENAIHLAGAQPVYFDIVKNGLHVQTNHDNNYDILISPHMFGFPLEIPSNLANKTIEDCAQGIGSRINGDLVGTQSSLSIFSFYATKLITSSGQGGMIFAKNNDTAEFIRDFIHFDSKNDGLKRFNFQMTDIQAAMGLVQLNRLFLEFIPRRDEIYNRYVKAGLNMFDIAKERLTPVRYRALYQTNNPERVISELLKYNINAIIPIKESEILGSKASIFPNSLENTKKFVSLPCYPSLTNDQVKYIIKSLKKIEEIDSIN